MEFWTQIVINGLVLGLTYGLLASGLTLVLGISRIINFAHGEFYMLAGFGIYWISTVFGVNYFLALPITMILVGGLGWGVERVFYRPVRTSFLQIVVVSIGLMVVIPAVTQLVFSEKDRVIGTMVPGLAHILGATVAVERLVVIGISLLVMLALWYLVQRTKLGLAMRAVAEDPEAATLQGIDVNNTASLSMFVGCGLGAAAGGILAPLLYVSPFVGPDILFKAFIVIILGGMGTITGAVAAGLLLGFAEVIGGAFIGGWIDIIPFVLALAVLVFRPTGLLGKVEV